MEEVPERSLTVWQSLERFPSLLLVQDYRTCQDLEETRRRVSQGATQAHGARYLSSIVPIILILLLHGKQRNRSRAQHPRQ
jgi:hypothetical protein